MLLRNSISNTRKFFQKTLGGLKSLFSGGSYEKLPKSPLPLIPSHDMNIKEKSKGSDKLYNDLTRQWGAGDIDSKACKRTKKVKSFKADNKVQDDHDQIMKKPSVLNSSAAEKTRKKIMSMTRSRDQAYPSKVVILKRKEEHNNSHEERIVKNFALVEKKLKELEMMDVSNVDHVLDIEEVLHYYSRLSCPAYLEIVDRFFMEIFAEFFGSSTPTRPRSVMIKT